MPQEEQLLAGIFIMVRIDIIGCRILRFIVITAVAGAALALAAVAAGAGAVLIFLLL